jgi:hypothetical protein
MTSFSSEAWAREEFGSCQLGHRARLKRLLKIAATWVENPRASIPTAFAQWSQAQAVYRFASNPNVSHAVVMQGPVHATIERCRGRGRILVVQDTTHVSLGGEREDAGLGPVDSTGFTKGFLAHTALALGPDREPIGVLAQEVWARTGPVRSRKETPAARKKRARESEKWLKASAEVESAIAALGKQRPVLVQVFDAEGDTFEALETLQRLGHGFVIRAGRERLLDPDEDEARHLAEAVATAPVRGAAELDVPARPGREARRARIQLRARSVCVEPPKNRGRRGNSLELNVVHVNEPHPPPGVDAISWVLFTTEPIDSFEDCVSVVSDYSARWLIEEFHMALKTGCSLERRQLQSFDALSTLLAICNPIAVMLLRMRHVARARADTPATDVLAPAHLAALRVLRPQLATSCTIREAIRAIASIGGFLGRKSDGEPGWRTIWTGFRDVLLVARTFEARSGSA